MINVNSNWLAGKIIQDTTVAEVTSEYAWAKTTKELLDKIPLSQLEKDYLVRFVDPQTVPEEAWFKSYQANSNTVQVPYLIWCRRIETCEYAIGFDVSSTRITYRPVKKADIPVASFD